MKFEIHMGDTRVISEINRLSNDVHALQKRIDELTIQQRILENISYDGKLLWKFDNISARITHAEKGKITALYSAPAYTDGYGYKFCARIYLNGDGIGRDDHVSLFFVLMKSEYDDLLEWPFYKEVTCRLLNPDNLDKSKSRSFTPTRDSSCYSKPKINMGKASGFPLFIEKKRDGFIKNDCIYIELEVE